MGTRNLTMVVHDGRTKIAQYGQWDGYPEGQGEDARTFLRPRGKVFDRERFIRQLKRCRWITEAESDELMKKIGSTNGWMNAEQAEQYHKLNPYLTRDNGAEILSMVMNAEGDGPIIIHDSSDFAADSLFCEWAYVIDLDKNTFEVYIGFNKEPVPAGERFSNVEPERNPKGEIEYYPIRHLVTFHLDEMPDKRTFVRACNKARRIQEGKGPKPKKQTR